MLLEPLVSAIETIKARIATHGTALRENEIRTRMALIDPLLQALGWDTSDPSLVLPEFDVSGRKADYALLENGGNPAATLEAKKLGEPLSSHRMQMLNYSNASGVEFAGLTDGDKWEFYEVFKRGQLEDRRVLDVSIADAPSHVSALKLLLLWRPNLASGQPVAASKPESHVEPTEPIPQPRTKESSLAPPQVADNWISLNSIDNVTGMKAPVAVRFAGVETRPVRAWWQVLVESAEFLASKGILTINHFPITTERGLRFINSARHSPTGRNYLTPKAISNGVTLETHLSSKAVVSYSKRLLSHFGTDPETVELRFE